MLKIKKELNYRRGTKKERCLFCTAFVAAHLCIGMGGVDIGEQPRCLVIGLKPGRMYRVDSGKLCDKFADKFTGKSGDHSA